MFEDVKKNKIKSLFIVFLFLIFIAFIIYYVCMALDFGNISVFVALFFAFFSTWGSYFYSDTIILKLNKARPATKEENQKLVNILDSLVISSGLPTTPKLYIIEDEQPNAFATGRNPQNSIICVTTGLLDKLTYYELEGVIAHEMAHIKNYDILLSAVVSVMVGFVLILSDWFTRISFFGTSRDRDDDSKGNSIIMLIGLIFLILSPIFATLMQLAISRKREFLADATSVEFTRNPDGLISALEKLSNDSHQLKVANKATENMYIVNPYRRRDRRIWSTHPSIEDRIEALRNIK